jgi:hypothetical protein
MSQRSRRHQSVFADNDRTGTDSSKRQRRLTSERFKFPAALLGEIAERLLGVLQPFRVKDCANANPS